MDARLTFVCVSAIAVISACGSATATDNGPTKLFDETFSTSTGEPSNLATNWVVGASGACTSSNTDQDVAGTPAQGNPSFALVFKCAQGGSIADLSNVRSIATWVLNTPMTFAADARVDLPLVRDGNPPLGMDFTLNALNTGLIYARVTIGPGNATFVIRTGTTNVQTIRTFTADGNFHRYVFSTDGKSNAEWRRDGALQANTDRFSNVTANLYVQLQAPSATPTESSNGHFDNVLVTAP